MHLAPLAGIETKELHIQFTIMHIWMHLAPLAGIETEYLQNIPEIFLMHLAPLAGIETTIRLHIGCIASILDAFWVWVEKISAMHTTNEKLTQALGYCPGQKNYRSSAA